MNEENGVITLPQIPKGQEYEHYIAALLQCGGCYLERNITKSDDGLEILELDIAVRNFQASTERTLVEVKSGKWGMTDVFKVRGWMDYLKIENGAFVVQENVRNNEKDFKKQQQVATEIHVKLISNENLDIKSLCEAFKIDKNIDPLYVEAFQYSYAIEWEMERLLTNRKKSQQETMGFEALSDFLFDVKSNSFFHNDPKARIDNLFKTFISNRNITARLAQELKIGTYPDYADDIDIPKDDFRKLFYDTNEQNILYVALYAELIARLTILSTCIEDILMADHSSDNWIEDFFNNLHQDTLPQNIKNGMEVLKTHRYVKQYPCFWQVFIYLFGGFILLDKEQEEYQMLSDITSIPQEEIPNALCAFDIMFPINDESPWLITQGYSNIKFMRFFPMPLCSVGANLWKSKLGVDDYTQLSSHLSGLHTIKDLKKWNNLGYEYLRKFVRDIEKSQ